MLCIARGEANLRYTSNHVRAELSRGSTHRRRLKTVTGHGTQQTAHSTEQRAESREKREESTQHRAHSTHLSQEGDVVEVKQGGGFLDRAALHEGEVSGHPGVDDGAALLLRKSDLWRGEESEEVDKMREKQQGYAELDNTSAGLGNRYEIVTQPMEEHLAQHTAQHTRTRRS